MESGRGNLYQRISAQVSSFASEGNFMSKQTECFGLRCESTQSLYLSWIFFFYYFAIFLDLRSHSAYLNFRTRACTGYPVSNYFDIMPFNSVSPICKSLRLALTSTHVACSVCWNIFVLTFRSKEIISAKVCCFYVPSCHVRSCFPRLIQFSILLQFLSSVVISDPLPVKFPAVCDCLPKPIILFFLTGRM